MSTNVIPFRRPSSVSLAPIALEMPVDDKTKRAVALGRALGAEITEEEIGLHGLATLTEIASRMNYQGRARWVEQLEGEGISLMELPRAPAGIAPGRRPAPVVILASLDADQAPVVEVGEWWASVHHLGNGWAAVAVGGPGRWLDSEIWKGSGTDRALWIRDALDATPGGRAAVAELLEGLGMALPSPAVGVEKLATTRDGLVEAVLAARQWNKAELAERLGVSPARLRAALTGGGIELERGKVALERIARACGVPSGWFRGVPFTLELEGKS